MDAFSLWRYSDESSELAGKQHKRFTLSGFRPALVKERALQGGAADQWEGVGTVRAGLITLVVAARMNNHKIAITLGQHMEKMSRRAVSGRDVVRSEWISGSGGKGECECEDDVAKGCGCANSRHQRGMNNHRRQRKSHGVHHLKI
jgi:hypothetical protein